MSIVGDHELEVVSRPCNLVPFDCSVDPEQFMDGTNKGADFTGSSELENSRLTLLLRMSSRKSPKGIERYGQATEDYLVYLEKENSDLLSGEFGYFRAFGLPRHEVWSLGNLTCQLGRVLYVPSKGQLDKYLFELENGSSRVGSEKYLWMALSAIRSVLNVAEIHED